MSPNLARMAVRRAAFPAQQPATAPIAARAMSRATLSQVILATTLAPAAPPSLPVANSQSGSLFEDQGTSSVRWYMPGYTLAAADPTFGFAASQADVDAAGNPFNKCKLTLRLLKTVPADAAAFHAANPTVEMREVPLHISSITLVTSFKDIHTGQPTQASYPCTAQAVAPDGTLDLTFDNILGPAVVILYENLTADGSAQVVIASTAEMVMRVPAPPAPGTPPPASLGGVRVRTFVVQPRAAALQPQAVALSPQAAAIRAAPFMVMANRNSEAWRWRGDIHIAFTYAPTTLANSQSVACKLTFADPQYQLKYTIATRGAAPRPILNVQDLQSFNVNQTEFTELKSLGDISQRYPSLSRLYLGVLSHTIVVIPRRYAIARSEQGCLAVCQALLDSSPSRASRCKFEFSFVLAAEVSPVEFVQLSNEIANRPEFKDHTVKLPDLLVDHPPATLATVFQSSFAYSGGLQAHTFALNVEIKDQDLDSPAVANANLLLKGLEAPHQPYLTGAMGLKLDDGYPSPVQSNVVLNFNETSGTDELSVNIDEASGTIQLQNHSPLDLAVSRAALSTGSTVTVVAVNQTIASGGTASIPLPAEHSDLRIAVDAQLALPSPVTKDDMMRYLTFQVQDVQDTQFSLAVNASGVKFASREIDHMDVQITFPDLPQIVPPPLSLNKLRTTDGTQVVIPIQNAVTELQGTATLRVHFTDAQKPAVVFTLQNDFCDQAILVVNDSDIPQ